MWNKVKQELNKNKVKQK